MQINRSRSSRLPPSATILKIFFRDHKAVRPLQAGRSSHLRTGFFPSLSLSLSLVRENPPANKRVTPSHLTRGTRAGTARVAVFIKSHGTK